MTTTTGTNPRDIAMRLTTIWQRILDHDEFGSGDNFFDVGGHSLVATELAIAIEEEFGVHLPAEIVFDYPTIDELCALIANKA